MARHLTYHLTATPVSPTPETIAARRRAWQILFSLAAAKVPNFYHTPITNTGDITALESTPKPEVKP
jgi:hypothetical protein